MTKTLFIFSVAQGYGGAERSVELIVRDLPQNVEAWVFAHHPEHLRQLRSSIPAGRNVSIVPIGPTDTLLGKRRAVFLLLRLYRKIRPHAVLVNTHLSALLAAMLARWQPDLGRRCALYIRDFQWTELDYILGRLPACRLLVPSEAVLTRQGYLVPWYVSSADDRHCAVVPDMVSESLPSDPPGDGFLHLATVNPWKGHADLIAAVEKLTCEGEHMTISSLGMVADSALYERLQHLIARLRLSERFRLLPYEADVKALLASCRAVVVPSVSHSGGPESFGRSVVEAWACGKPVIAYAVGGPAHLIRNELDGLLIAEGDVEGLARAMARLNRDDGLCARLGAAGRERVAEQFLSKRVVPRLLNELFESEAHA